MPFNFGCRHFLFLCDRTVADSAISVIRQSDPLIEISNPVLTEARALKNVFSRYKVFRGTAKIEIGISVIGSMQGQESVDGEYWIFVDSVGFFSRSSIALAEFVKSILLEMGAQG